LQRLLTTSLAIFVGAHALACAGQDAASLSSLPPVEYLAQQPVETIPSPKAQQAGALTLAEVEQLALSFNPTLAEAAARVRAARGEQLQVGLPPNPTFGYLGSEIGNDGRAGQQGIVFGQEFIRGNKLGLNRAVAAREAERREQEFAAQQRRVLTDVRVAFYDAFLAQQRAELSRRLQAIGEQSVATTNALLEAQEGRRTDLLQAEIEGQRAGIAAAQAEANVQGAWRRLAALVGQHEMEVRPLAADLQLLRWQATWDETLVELLQASPEVAEAQAAVDRGGGGVVPDFVWTALVLSRYQMSWRKPRCSTTTRPMTRLPALR
jgi:outer membrane protein, heavy metal efflux system